MVTLVQLKRTNLIYNRVISLSFLLRLPLVWKEPKNRCHNYPVLNPEDRLVQCGHV